uniref:Aspartate aminotransferase n=1 Tax=Timema shepardi TaxID=629360 RepID=A0A7R9B329_TIMSH|nr:unnamed protein product [Timema shepardi]
MSSDRLCQSYSAYRTDEGEPWVLPVVRRTELQMAADEELNHEYLPVLGLGSFSSAATSLLLGADNAALLEGRVLGVQTVSGSGAIRVGAEFLTRHVLHYGTFYTSSPTFINHALLFLSAGFVEHREYKYWDDNRRTLDLEGFLENLREAPENSVVVLHACAHNPTGCDPTHEQWEKIADVIEITSIGLDDFIPMFTFMEGERIAVQCWREETKRKTKEEERNLFPFFDIAYQGFASGDLDDDAWAVRHFVNRGMELFCAQSFSKNFGLYNERVGNLTVVLKDKKHLEAVKSQITLTVRGMYSNPPNHGGRIVATILNNPQLKEEWKESIRTMANRILSLRSGLKERLQRLGTPGNWDHISSQIGMFSYTGLTRQQAAHLKEHYHIYMLPSGRISMCGINSSNIEYLSQSIHDTVLLYPNNERQHKL